MKNSIKFGTDGWRGITGFDFVEDRVKLISAGVCRYLKDRVFTTDSRKKNPLVVIGYDTRFLSERFAQSSAAVLCANGVEAEISDSFLTSPALSYAVVNKKADLGIMITASHNPYYYNGYKIKGPFGGSATMDIISGIEAEVNYLCHNRELKSYMDGESCADNNKLQVNKSNLVQDYKKYILSLADLDLIGKKFDFPVVVDPMYGAGQGIFREIISGLSRSNVHEIHGVLNSSFGGINPEPIGDNLTDAIYCLKEKNCQLALCIDGDGDRIGAIGANGNFISSHHIFAVVLDYLVRVKNYRGKVVKTVSTSSIIDRICKKYNLELAVKPVGFKYIGDEILSGGIIMGGEESGGLWAKGFIPERDGIRMSLLLLEVICHENKSINEILKEIYNLYGFFLYKRTDYEISQTDKEILKKSLAGGIPEVLKSEGASEPVLIDGYKYFFPDGSWLMIRPSGTESVVRIYAESDCSDKLERLHELGRRIIRNPYDERQANEYN
jgi:alpha-D-glucose phosphate-specific phosphoglucomutase